MLRRRPRPVSGRRLRLLNPLTESLNDVSQIRPLDSAHGRRAPAHSTLRGGARARVRAAAASSRPGASSYGYDMRLADDGFRVFSPIHGREIDPKTFDEDSLVEPPLRDADDGSRYYLMPPHSYALGVTVETFRMPRNVTGICMGKSTYARAGLLRQHHAARSRLDGPPRRRTRQPRRPPPPRLRQRRHRPGHLPRIRRRLRRLLRRPRRQIPGPNRPDLLTTLKVCRLKHKARIRKHKVGIFAA